MKIGKQNFEVPLIKKREISGNKMYKVGQLYKDTFMKQEKKASLSSLYNSDGSIYCTLKVDGHDKLINAFALNYEEPPYQMIDKNLNLKLYMSYSSIEKTNDKDMFTQALQGFVDTDTTIIGAIDSIDEENNASIKIDGFAFPVFVELNDSQEYKCGDKVKVEGVLDCEFSENNQ